MPGCNSNASRGDSSERYMPAVFDRDTQELAYLWPEVNHPCEQLGLTVELDSTSPNLRAGLFARSICG